jgi:DNA excision repair protein ERCC-3
MLRRDHPLRPLFISGRSLWLEAFSPLFLAAQDFLLAIAEPLNRPAHVHEYAMTRFSLLAAVSAGLDAHSILKGLSTLSKTSIPEEMIQFIQSTVAVAGKLRLILRNGSYYVEVASSALFQQLLSDQIISQCIVESFLNGGLEDVEDPFFDDAWMDMETQPASFEFPQSQAMPTQLPYFKIQLESVETVRKRCLELSFPILEEFDFKDDTTGTRLEIDLKSTTRLRHYQEKSLNKMFSNGRARSGIIVLPCGAGKTLVGITAVCTIKKSCLVLCTSR